MGPQAPRPGDASGSTQGWEAKLDLIVFPITEGAGVVTARWLLEDLEPASGTGVSQGRVRDSTAASRPARAPCPRSACGSVGLADPPGRVPGQRPVLVPSLSWRTRRCPSAATA